MLPWGLFVTLLRRRAGSFADLASDPSELEKRLANLLMHHSGQRASPAEIRSWSGSLPILAQDLLDADLADVEVLIEYRLPLTSRRADIVLAGKHPKTGSPSYVVVELKQWSRATRADAAGELVTVDGVQGGPRLHPVAQVEGYCNYLVDFTKYLHELPDPIAGAAYLHNAGPATASSLSSYPISTRGQLFTSANRGAFLDFLRSRLATNTPGAPYADRLIQSAIAPSRQLLTVAADELAHREQFVLLDEQRVAVQMVYDAVDAARKANSKSVIVITGGPGSGKSVIALSLMGELARRGHTAVHATGSRSFTQTLRSVAVRGRSRAAGLFKYFNSFMDAEPNGLDVLILDEAHRIRETSANRYTRASLRTGEPQVNELLAAARVPVFLLDEHQVVRPGEMGTLADITEHASALHLPVQHISLNAQYRCGGSERYVRWVERLLKLRGEEPLAWEPEPGFAVHIVDSPDEMESRLRAFRDDGYGARMTAGYCWPWSDPTKDGELVPDVQIGTWSKPWNLRGDRGLPTAPPAALWATKPEGFEQVGCVYTAQGFEYDWNGVIFGPDLVWRTDKWISRREFNKDPDFRSRKAVSDADFDRLVRHVYKVLLTRGMLGTLIYSVDEETRDFLRSPVK